jgi:hypothetical protein
VIEMTERYGKPTERLDLFLAGTVVLVGPSGGGKSAQVAEIAGRLGAALLSANELLIPESERPRPGLLANYELRALAGC